MASKGALIIVAAAVAGMAVSGFNYFNIDSGIAYEPGTVLVIVSTLIMVVFGVLMGSAAGGKGFRGFISGSCLLNILGTGFAAYLLHSQALLALMAAGFIGWVLHVFRRRSVKS